MKLYKLKKDLPTFNAGDEFYLGYNKNLYLKDSNIMAYNHITLEKFPNILKDWFEEITEYKRWRAKYGEEYWYASNGGSICCDTEDGHIVDNHRFLTGNYFKAREEAETRKEYLLARQVLLDDADGGNWIEGDCNWYAFYSGTDWAMNIPACYRPGTIYFKTYRSLEASLDKHKDQWDIVRKYETGEK